MTPLTRPSNSGVPSTRNRRTPDGLPICNKCNKIGHIGRNCRISTFPHPTGVPYNQTFRTHAHAVTHEVHPDLVTVNLNLYLDETGNVSSNTKCPMSPLVTDCNTMNTTAVARTLIGGGGGVGCLFIYSCSARLVSFQIKFKF